MTELDEISEQIEGLVSHFDTKFESLRMDVNKEVGSLRDDVRELRTEVRDDRKSTRDEISLLRECDQNQKRQTGKVYAKLNTLEQGQLMAEQRDAGFEQELDEHKKNKDEHFNKEKLDETNIGYLAKKKVLLLVVAFLSIVLPALATVIVKWISTMGGP